MADSSFLVRVKKTSILVDNNGEECVTTSRDGAAPGRLNVGQQDGAYCTKTAVAVDSACSRVVWTKEMNVLVMDCYYSSRTANSEGKLVRGYRKRMYELWKRKKPESVIVSEQRL